MAEKPRKTAFDKHQITWRAYEHAHFERGKMWQAVTSTLAIAAIAIALFLGEWTFALAIAAFCLTYYLLNRKEPRVITVKISDIGIQVGKRKYPFSRIKAFWIIYEPPVYRTLHFKVNDQVVNEIQVELHNQDPGQIREFLIKKVPELQNKTQSLTAIIQRTFKL